MYFGAEANKLCITIFFEIIDFLEFETKKRKKSIIDVNDPNSTSIKVRN
jgi:hypothetical protein